MGPPLSHAFALLATGEFFGGLLAGLLALVVGGGLLYDGLRRIRFRRRALSAFERVDATVVESAVLRRTANSTRAVPDVEYEYTVDGETYRTGSLWPTRGEDPPTVDARVARRIVEDYPEGAAIIANYDPEDPSTAYLLEDASERRQFAEVVAGGLFVLTALAVGAVVAVG